MAAYLLHAILTSSVLLGIYCKRLAKMLLFAIGFRSRNIGAGLFQLKLVPPVAAIFLAVPLFLAVAFFESTLGAESLRRPGTRLAGRVTVEARSSSSWVLTEPTASINPLAER